MLRFVAVSSRVNPAYAALSSSCASSPILAKALPSAGWVTATLTACKTPPPHHHLPSQHGAIEPLLLSPFLLQSAQCAYMYIVQCMYLSVVYATLILCAVFQRPAIVCLCDVLESMCWPQRPKDRVPVLIGVLPSLAEVHDSYCMVPLEGRGRVVPASLVSYSAGYLYTAFIFSICHH